MNVSEKDKIRIERSTKNATVALITSILMGVLSFVERIQFNHYFLDDYLGLYSFFNNVINVLSCSELGITTAIGYALFKPVANNDEGQIKAIISFMKKIYFAIGTFITLSGLLIIPLFPYILKTNLPYSSVSVYFIIFVLRTAFSYWLMASSIILFVNQEQYIQTFIQNMTWCLQYILLIIVTVTTKNFLVYCIILFGCSLFCSIFIRQTSRKRYPIVKERSKEKLNKEYKDAIIKNTKGLIATNIGSVIVNSTDSILISAMVSAAFLGKYSNYQMIISGLSGVMGILPNAITASIGNQGVTESKRKIVKGFETISLAHYFCYSVLTVILMNISNPIVETFFGSNKTISTLSLSLVCINFYINSLRQISKTYKSSLGLYWYDRKRPVFEMIANILFSIVLGYFWGFNGIILGTVLTNLAVNIWYEPLIIYHHGFKRSAFSYYFSIALRALLTVGIAIISMKVCSFLPQKGLFGIIARTIISLLISLTVLFIVFCHNSNAKSIITTAQYAIFKKKN